MQVRGHEVLQRHADDLAEQIIAWFEQELRPAWLRDAHDALDRSRREMAKHLEKAQAAHEQVQEHFREAMTLYPRETAPAPTVPCGAIASRHGEVGTEPHILYDALLSFAREAAFTPHERAAERAGRAVGEEA